MSYASRRPDNLFANSPISKRNKFYIQIYVLDVWPFNDWSSELLRTPSVPINSIQFPFWDVPSFLYIPNIVTFNNIKHYYTHFFLPLSPFYNNINTITPTIFLHYLKSIIKYKWVPPLYSLFISLYSLFTLFLGLRVQTKCIQSTGTEGVLNNSKKLRSCILQFCSKYGDHEQKKFLR